MEWIAHHLPLILFAVLAIALFCGYPVAFVLGHEAHGLAPDLPLDELVTIPMAAGESLNVAMAGTVLLFEAARQRRIS